MHVLLRRGALLTTPRAPPGTAAERSRFTGARPVCLWSRPWDVPPARDGSFESLCVEAGLENAFVPLRGLRRSHPLARRISARPLGNAPKEALWPEHCDAFLFTRTQTPSAPMAGTHPFALAPAIEERLAAIAAREAAGGVWSHQWNLHRTLGAWLAATDASAGRIEAEETRWIAWLDEAVEADPLVWRVHDLLGDMALARGGLDAAIGRWDAAIASYPDRPVPDPRKHDGVQHVASAAMLARLERDGFDEALRWYADTLTTTRAFRYAFLPTIEAELDARRSKTLRDALREAYEARGERWSDEAERAKTYARAL